MLDDSEKLIRNKMRNRGLSDSRIELFVDMVRRARLLSPYTPLQEALAPTDEFTFQIEQGSRVGIEMEARGKAILDQVVVVKLNGGRSTTMGGDVPKGILVAKNGMSYIEIILGQMGAIREKWQVNVPLVLMNSFFTHRPTVELINRFDNSVWTFEQKQVPRLLSDTYTPMDTGTDEDWAPPGHGDIYESFLESGLLQRFLRDGYRWAFISNMDNLAANLEPWILGLMDGYELDFILEVTDRTQVDQKGGTLVLRNGMLELLEIAQVDPECRQEFIDIDRFSVFNTNNVWIDLEALNKVLAIKSLNLPIIQNYKTVAGIKVVQLETAMGAAIGSFHRAKGLRVSRDRFFPTKRVEDLFVLQSDACVLDSMNRLRRNSARPKWLPHMPIVTFDPAFLDSPLKIHERFEDPASVSLLSARSLKVSGSVFFERDVRIEGDVEIEAHPGELFSIPRGCTLVDGKYP